MRYLQRKSLPPDIDYLRELGHRTELEPERIETVLHYNKKMRFELEASLRDHFGQAEIRRIHDVLRFDVSHFLAKMADPRQKMSYFTTHKGILTTEAPRVYHLNMVFRYRVSHFQEGKMVDQATDYERLRVILNKKGIVRVETVVPRGELGQEEGYETNLRGELPPLVALHPLRLTSARVGL